MVNKDIFKWIATFKSVSMFQANLNKKVDVLLKLLYSILQFLYNLFMNLDSLGVTYISLAVILRYVKALNTSYREVSLVTTVRYIASLPFQKKKREKKKLHIITHTQTFIQVSHMEHTHASFQSSEPVPYEPWQL